MPSDLTNLPRLHIAGIDLPREVQGLYDIASNLWWTWNNDARELFAAMDSRAWSLYRNPVQLLINFDRDHWQPKLEDERFLGLYQKVLRNFEAYMAGGAESWFAKTYPEITGPIAYFCMEYGLHQTLPLYSGGLGVLAGDHLKSASDLGVPLVGVGLLYKNGYFHQNIDADGRQQHIYPEYDFSRLPLRPAASHTGRPVVISIPFGDRELHLQVWIALVGRVPLLLLDADVPQNDSADRPITSILYTPGREMRLAQEIVLGIGGARALAALGIEPAVWHMNEGHSAFLQFERLRGRMLDRGESFDDGIAELRRTSVFTTHTPVPAGNEVFEAPLVRAYFDGPCAEIGIAPETWLGLGNNDHGAPNQPFNMTALAIRTSSRINGVSELNAHVSAKMWQHLIPADRPEPEQIRAITNGVHVPTWLGVELAELFASWFGERWREIVTSPEGREAILAAPDAPLWEVHIAQKRRLARFLRARLRDQFARHGLSPGELRKLEHTFDPEVLTIGFARRFATYKRAGLLFSDLHRLRKLVADEKRPLQILLAGKAHPADKAGQELIQHIFQLSQSEALKGRVFFVEDYDLRVGRMLVQGVDVWLNTPRRPMEASGTSGMKAAMNGALNCSIADGWWPEGYDGENGWVIGANNGSASADFPADEAKLDREDGLALYDLLEEQIVPIYYDRDANGLSVEWLRRMKEAIATITPKFSSDRMVRDYTQLAYASLLSALIPDEVAKD
ncbi:MAG: alpha-glucan family phosphorylase [Thermoanaerobaculia bacterium]